ncbi:MAG: hypothetical protein Q9M40_06060 [Sulfurimonas sp.]|nr:hypothetical protein [Sulfurimonas sp.]
MRQITKILLLLTLFSATSYAVSVEEGIAESNRGNHARAFEIFQTACEENNPVACKYVAEAYNKGITVKTDVPEGFRVLYKSHVNSV